MSASSPLSKASGSAGSREYANRPERRATRRPQPHSRRRKYRRRPRNCRPPPPISGPASLHGCARAPRACSWSRGGHQQNVGMTRRGDEAQAEALEIVEGVVERVDLELAGIARAASTSRMARPRPASCATRPRFAASSARVASSAPAAAQQAPAGHVLEEKSAHVSPRGRAPNRSS